VVLGAAGGFFYMRKQAADREAQMRADSDKQNVARAKETKGSLDVKCGADEGCSVWINGELQKQVTPTKVEGLPLDSEIKLKLTKEGFEAHRESITLTDQEPTKTIQAVMKTGSVTVVLKIDPPATVWLDNKPLKGLVEKLEGLSAGEEHKLVLQLAGYVPKTITFTAEKGETKVIQERLVKADPNQVAKAGEGAGAGSPGASSGGSGKVRVTSKGGFCNVTINGTGYGSTPVEAVVNAGTARVSCKPEGGGPSQSQAVQVKSGEVGRVAFKLN
jgi:eukaryotic-like serine/threonine-protein kinase